ncbi:uncharacterized protein LOC100575185 [Acyrthosiphon pisum]|uniref:Uncharacterized protein n=1 Tax=Acyrthosiphon pisum TaxID=7029 RepID=A0A8R2AAH1_ACYPI|nr:uncharacterized protein LOC100575185 [Acyrthosiphon pisum]|eukprot:XP_003240562.1 PREDICTED: uncharacterized protein LOC100575185 [Acyrthosiphon pisum]
MTFPAWPICTHRYFCLLLISTCYYYGVTTAITVVDHVSKDRYVPGAENDRDTVDDMRLGEKVEDEDAENKHFMDVYSLQSGPQQLEFGHVFEDPNVWEQRYEKKDFDAQRYQGKVKWGDKDGSYGEQYWDLNHGGGGSNENEKNEPYEEPTPIDYGQESRQRPVIYKPMMMTLLKNKPKKPVKGVRNYPKRLVEPPAAPTTIGSSAKKTAPVLVFDMKTGVVMDEATGNKFILKPIKD